MEKVILFRKSLAEEDEFLYAQKFWGDRVYENLLKIPHNSLVIGRYSVLPYYKELEDELKIIGSKLINSYKQHLYVADIENWYSDLVNYTPKTYFNWANLPEGSYVVKGRTNSRKHQWNRRMFAKTKVDVPIIANSLLDDFLVQDQGICVREYVPLKRFGTGINELPITNEWRTFWFGDQLIDYGYYWTDHPEFQPLNFPLAGIELAEKVAKIVSKSINFFVIDVAQKEDGGWIVIELNDSQMSGLSMINSENFYNNLYKAIECW